MIHEKLSHITSTNDEQLKRKLMAEILDYFQSESADTSILGDLLASSNEEVSLLAFSLLHDLNYPQHASILSALLHQIAYGDIEHTEQVGYKALLAVIRMGPTMLAKVTTLITEKDDGEELVYDALANMGRLFWERFEESDANRIVHSLAQFPASVIDFLVFVLRKPLKDWWDTAVLTIREIGYPQNASALPALMMTATDPNTPGAREALDYLIFLDADVVVPHFLKAMLFPEANEQYPGWYTTCVLLHYMDQKCLYPCGPSIVFLLDSHRDLLPYQLSYLVSLLEILGSDCAFYALPTLLNVLHHEGIAKVRQRVWHLIHSFDQHLLLPYKVVLASLKPQVESENG